jgi:aryl-alcohol dehydrogenase-like predicted oxidoreductase
MRYRLLGRSGLRVSELALGTMTFGEDWGWGASKEVSRKILERFAEAGGNFIDTANNYTDGTSERFVGEFLGTDRDHFVLATKYSLTERPEDPNFGGNHRKNMIRSLEGSLQRLATDRVDLLWLHMWDGMTPVSEVLRAMDDLARAGKVLYVGFSDTPAWVVAQAVTEAELRGWVRPVGIQAPYSVLDRGVERDLLPMARANELAVTVWGMLEGGTLTGKYRAPDRGAARYEGASEKELAAGDAVAELAGEIGRSPAQVAIGWIRARRDRAQIIPILGARTVDQLDVALGVLEFELTDDQVRRLDDVAPIDLGFPHSFLASDHVRGLIFGDTFGSIDTHRR